METLTFLRATRLESVVQVRSILPPTGSPIGVNAIALPPEGVIVAPSSSDSVAKPISGLLNVEVDHLFPGVLPGINDITIATRSTIEVKSLYNPPGVQLGTVSKGFGVHVVRVIVK